MQRLIENCPHVWKKVSHLICHDSTFFDGRILAESFVPTATKILICLTRIKSAIFFGLVEKNLGIYLRMRKIIENDNNKKLYHFPTNQILL